MELRPLGAAPRFPADSLLRALSDLREGAWGQMSTLEQSGTHHGYRVLPLIGPEQRLAEAGPFEVVLGRFAPVYQAWLSWLEPGGFILPHVDAGPYRERWQVPFQPAGTMNGQPAVAGVAFPVRHWESHSVTNDTDGPRIHLVVDRALVLDESPVPFQRVEETP